MCAAEQLVLMMLVPVKETADEEGGRFKKWEHYEWNQPSHFFYKHKAPPDMFQYTTATDFSDVTMGNSVVTAAV